MREIRAWDKHEQKMIYAEEAGDSKIVFAIGFHGLPIAIDGDSFKADQIVGWNVDHRLIPMQFTGKTDKNRKKIYEDDIVLWCGGQYTIKFSDIEGTWILKDDRDDWECPSLYAISSPQQSRIEVISNIYEHPEMVKEQ